MWKIVWYRRRESYRTGKPMWAVDETKYYTQKSRFESGLLKAKNCLPGWKTKVYKIENPKWNLVSEHGCMLEKDFLK